MIGLTQYDRDLGLPSQLGDDQLAPPSSAELVDLVNEHLIASGGREQAGGRADSAATVHVRYKPGVAVAATYEVTLQGGASRAVTYKAHLGTKTGEREVGGSYATQLEAHCAPLRPFAHLAERHASLWVFPADPELRGAIRALDKRRTARWIDRLDPDSPWVVRLRPTTVTLRRYKHSRRAVFHVAAKLRGEGEARSTRDFGLRVLPVREAARSFKRRQALAHLDLPLPKCLGTDATAGWILEEWLPGTPAARGDFSIAPAALGCAAKLHGAPDPEGWRSETRKRVAPLDLIASVDGSKNLPAWLREPLEVPSGAWIHGDLHPDQVILNEGSVGLLDLDNLRRGSIEEDLAAWLADGLVDASTERSYDEQKSELLEHYAAAGGPPVDEARLRALASIEVLARAAGSIRRLEVNALRKAGHCVDLAASLARRAL